MATLDTAALRQVLTTAAGKVETSVRAGDAIQAADTLIAMLEDEAARNGIKANFGWVHGEPMQFEGVTTINVYPLNNTRPSLWPGNGDKKGYPEGAYDLVDLFDFGYTADDYVYGQWHGGRARSRLSFKQTNFLENARDSFIAATGYNVTISR